MNDSNLHLLLSYDDDGSPVLKDGLPEAAAAVQEPEKKKDTGALDFWEPGSDPNDLVDQRWGVIAPEGPEGERLLALIRPLIEARKEAQGGEEIKIYHAPSGLSPKEASLWRKEHFEDGKGFTVDLPRYQLVLGDLHQVSLAIQQSQGTDGYVGRLCFREERDYEAYVDKVLRFEKARDKTESRAKFFTVHDGSRATLSGYQALIQPGLKLLRENAYEVEEIGNQDTPSPDEFLETARSPDPTVLFSVSHGAGAPRGGWASYEDQHDRQGAMSFGREGKIMGADIGDGPFLPGGLWFMLACYGAGTPTRKASAYRQWLQKLKSVGQFAGAAETVLAGLPKDDEAPFIARLPQAVLAKPDGPLAIMGHIDLAWTYGFEERDTGKPIGRPGKFMRIVRSALRGDRVGIAFRQFLDFISGANHEIAELYDEQERMGEGHVPDLARLGHLWMLRQDLAGYILLGDPAVQLPPSSGGKKRRPAATTSAGSAPAYSVQGAPPEETKTAAPAPAKLPIDIDKLEEAIGYLLTGEKAPKQLAKEYTIDRKELETLAEKYKQAGRAALGVK